MDRRFLAIVGMLDLLITIGLMSLNTPVYPVSFARLALFTVAGVLLVVAGTHESVTLGSTTPQWRAVANMGYVCFGLAVLANGLLSVLGVHGDPYFSGLSTLLLAPVILFMSIDYPHGGVHFSLSIFE